MRFTHADMPRTFRVPFGPWLLPTVGSLFCIVLLTRISEATRYRFLVWTVIGQIFYFSYGFWHSKRRPPTRKNSVKSTSELLSTVEGIMMEPVHAESEPEFVSEITENNTEEISVCYL
jgi:amino acid transporter